MTKVRPFPVLGKTQQVHFVGIGGAGMSGIAEVLINLGYRVTGSDLVRNPTVRRLESLGGRVFLGHHPDHVSGADVVVYSSAVKPDNDEVREARRRQIPAIPRAEMLGELMRMKYSIAIAGSHGKTSTTSMVAQVLSGAGLDPTIVIGGRLGVIGGGARLGGGDFLVAEADESDGSFLRLAPTVAVVTNIDAEHLDHYGHLDDLCDAFVDFLNRVPFFGGAVVCSDDARIRALLPRLDRRIHSYGLEANADLRALRIETRGTHSEFAVEHRGEALGRVVLKMPGSHNILNSLAAIAVGLELEIPFDSIAAALAGLQGPDRRFQILAEADGILVIDDYAHHPTEIRATLAAARSAWPDRRRVAVFQPHRFSRAVALADDFHRAFEDADLVLVTDIYPAGEKPHPDMTGQVLAAGIEREGGRQVEFVATVQELPGCMAAVTRPGDLVITLGAGDIGSAAHKFTRLLKERDRAAG